MDSKRKANGAVSTADELDDRGAKRRKVSVSPEFLVLLWLLCSVNLLLKVNGRLVATGKTPVHDACCLLPFHLGPYQTKIEGHIEFNALDRGSSQLPLRDGNIYGSC